MASVTEEQQRAVNRRTFMEAAKGLTAWRTDLVASRRDTGINWTGCNKGYLADQFAAGRMPARVIDDLRAEPRLEKV